MDRDYVNTVYFSVGFPSSPSGWITYGDMSLHRAATNEVTRCWSGERSMGRIG